MESSQTKNYTIFIGNPGVGKSALLNCIFEKDIFKSGIKIGASMTENLQIVFNERDLIHYGDTPGLYDIQRLKEAAEEISKPLKSGDGNYRIVFVLKLNSLRLSPQDSVMMEKVLESINIENISYGIILNWLPEKDYQYVIKNQNSQKNLLTCLNEGNQPTTFMNLFKYNQDINDDNFSTDITNDHQKRLNDLTSKFIKPDQVQSIDISDYDQKDKKLQNLIRLKLDNSEIRDQKLNEIIKEMQRQYKKLFEEQKNHLMYNKKFQKSKSQSSRPRGNHNHLVVSYFAKISFYNQLSIFLRNIKQYQKILFKIKMYKILQNNQRTILIQLL